MFRRCGGFGQHKAFQDDDSASSDEFGFDHVSRDELTSDGAKEHANERFVLEIVGALGLSALAEDVDSFCTVSKVSSKGETILIHRTKTIVADTAPIWTLKTKSICFVELAKGTSHEQIRVELCRKTVGIPGVSAKEVIGSVNLAYATLLANGDSARREYPVAKNIHPGIQLALRFRKASAQDFRAFQELHSEGNSNVLQKIAMARGGSQKRGLVEDHAGDIDFEHVTGKALLGNHTKVVEGGVEQKAYRVWPFPDPDNLKETTYMTKAKIQKAALEPSRNWVEAAGGAADNYGSVFLEIIGCDDLPNMDMEIVDGLTDAFVACVYEDNFVRTPIVHDSLNPRWMPWSHRAFEFHIQHPASILMLGVFDYDENPTLNHDPIGRVVIVPTLYEKDTVYTLKYPLHYEDENRGTLTVRLRILWHNAADASKAQSFVRPPRFIVNVKSAKSWKTLRYLTRGATDMTDVSIESVKLYATEVKEHWQRYCYFLDVLAHLVLWRGKIPIHSVVFFAGLSLAIEFPQYVPSVLMYLVAYALLSNNYFLSNHPSPWSRVRSFARVAFNNHFSSNKKISIEQGDGEEKAKLQNRLDEYRGLRAMAFLYKAMKTALGVYRVYSKSTPVDISTVSKSGNLISKLYVNYLSYAHLVLRMLCKYFRLIRNFVNWRSGSAYKFTVDMIMFATIWALFPYKQLVVKMTLRILLLVILGPQNRVFDQLWIRPYYRTREDLIRDGIPTTTEEMKADILSRPNILDPILSSKWVYEMGKTGRIVVEDNLKLQAAREVRFGRYSESVPTVDSSRFASVPTSSSFAQPYASPSNLHGPVKGTDGSFVDIDPESKIWSKVSGQKLQGGMIPLPAASGTLLPSEIIL